MSYLYAIIVAQIFLTMFVSSEDLIAVSVATEETDGLKRLVRSLKQYGYKYEILGLGEEWKGGNVKLHAGGGQKVNILIRDLEKHKDDENKIILFTDGYDVIVIQEPGEVLRKFQEFNARVVFGAEDFCWPDPSLEDDYPEVQENEKRFLNSGGFIGYASDLYNIITSAPILDDGDDQYFYTKIFLNKETRAKFNIKLDTKSEIFQNLNGASNELSIFSLESGEISLYNNVTKTVPSVVHGNGGSKMVLNRFGNYLAKAFSNNDGCIICHEDTIKLSDDNSEWPDVTVALFIEQATPFLKEFFQKFSELNYPKNKLTILIHNNVKYHIEEVEKFFKNSNNDYNLIKYIAPEDDSPESEARSETIRECSRNNCKYYFGLDSTVHLDNKDTLKLLIEQNRPILSPIMKRKGTTWSNVWGAVNEKGFYLRSDDYLDIINRNYLGVWNLPFVSEAVLINGAILDKIPLVYEDTYFDSSMAFVYNLRLADVFMYGTNMHYFGHLINPDGFNTSLVRPEMFEIFNNIDDWANRYIRSDYYDIIESKQTALQPCPDVYWFPLVSDEFCEDLITMMESYGKWSGGNDNKYDERLPGGYENVPTVDIHMTQIDYQKHWLHFLKHFVQPIQQLIFTGYYHDPPEASLNFVVRYRPGEQDHLKPHHDASTYTMNIALNRPGIDFEGGGCRFVRYNCSVTQTKKGWAMIHPGRLTHYHEGLKVTGGTRYIMVSFIDP